MYCICKCNYSVQGSALAYDTTRQWPCLVTAHLCHSALFGHRTSPGPAGPWALLGSKVMFIHSKICVTVVTYSTDLLELLQ